MIINQGNKELCLGSALMANATVSTLTTIAVPLLLHPSTVQEFLRTNNQRLGAAYETIRRFLEQRRLQFSPVQGGLSVFTRLLETASEEDESLLRNALANSGINLVPGHLYHLQEPNWFRIIFSVDPATLSDALGRIGEALDLVKETRIQQQAKEIMKRTPLVGTNIESKYIVYLLTFW
jgi:aspartate/methionine/tyrosine aminotransferase